MRKKIVFVLLLGLLIGWGVLAGTRGLTPHDAPSVSVAPEPTGSSSAGPTGTETPAVSGSASASGSAQVPVSTGSGQAPSPQKKLMDRTLRVAALGWDLGAAGILANGGADPSPTSEFTAAGVDVKMAVSDSPAALEAALARGGEDKDGADIAIWPLPTFVASYERLRALSLDMFFVVGWSRGREAIVAPKEEWPVPFGPSAAKEVRLVGSVGEPATFAGLWALDLGGFASSAVRLVAPGSGADVPLAAIDRAGPPDAQRRSILFTTADAPYLIPYVAVAPRGLIEKQSRALTAWANVWLSGARKLGADAAGASRTVAGVQGAPEAVVLLQKLGLSGAATLADNVRALGLSGRGAVTLEALFQRGWALWRAAGALATPSPDLAPVSTGIVSSLARTDPSLVAPGGEVKVTPADGAVKVLVTYRQPEGKADDAALASTAGFLAGVFDRAPIRISVAQGAGVDANRTKKVIEDVQGRFGVPTQRLLVAKKPLSKTSASIEVLAVP